MQHIYNRYHMKTKKLNKKQLITAGISAFLLFSTAIGAGSHHYLSSRATADTAATSSSTPTISVTSPTANSYYPGDINLQATLSGMNVSQYDFFWYVDNGSWNWIGNSADGQSKQATINVSSWKWHAPSDAYIIQFVAVLHSNGQRIFSSIPIHVGTAPTSPTASTTSATAPAASVTTTAAQVTAPVSAAATTTNSTALYVNPNSSAAQTAASTGDATMKRVMTKLAATPTASWFGDWNSNVQSDVNNLVTAASNAKQTPVLVAYNIPERDCGSYSSGGASSADAYKAWIQGFAAGIGSRPAIVILEPDAVAQITCLSSSDQATRYSLLSNAVSTLKANTATKVYLDAGNANWVGASDMAGRLKAANVASADGFSLNVSNFIATSDSSSYGKQVSSQIGGKHFVIDTGRNGNGASSDWCNPSGRALGSAPTGNTGDSVIDYYLWIKTPGESDGTCNGGPAAGTWWPSYAETLALNAGW